MDEKEGEVIKKELKNVQLVRGAFGGEGERDWGAIENVSTPETGGIFTKYIGCNYLYKGYPDFRILDYIYASKRMVAGLFPLAFNKSVRLLIGVTFIFYLILPKPMKRKVIIGLLDYFLSIAYWVEFKYIFALPVEKYCPAIKETYRVSEVLLKDIKDNEILLRLKRLRDLPCMHLEMDYAYRARYQDILPEIDKERLKEDPRKEIERVLNLFIEREAVDGYNAMTDKWKGLKKTTMFALKFKGLRKLIVKALLEIDLEKIKRDEADWYYALDRTDYLYGGLTHEERMKISAELDKKVGNTRPKIIFKEQGTI